MQHANETVMHSASTSSNSTLILNINVANKHSNILLATILLNVLNVRGHCFIGKKGLEYDCDSFYLNNVLH